MTSKWIFAPHHPARQPERRRRRTAAGLRHPGRSPHRTAAQVCPLGDYLAEKQAARWCSCRSTTTPPWSRRWPPASWTWPGSGLHLCAGTPPCRQGGTLVQRQEDAPVHLQVHRQCRQRHQDPGRHQGQGLRVRLPSSTSGHLMPRHFLAEQGINPERDFAHVAFSGAHDATVAWVASGKVPAGALNASVWEKLVEEGKVDTTKVKVIWTTPTYFDYNWTVRGDMDPALQEKIKQPSSAWIRRCPPRPRSSSCNALPASSRPSPRITWASKPPPPRPAC